MKHSSLLYIGALLVSMALASCSEKDKPSVSSARNENKTPAPEAVENPADVRANESQSAFHLPALLMPGPLEPVPLDITDSTAQVPMLAVANIGRFAKVISTSSFARFILNWKILTVSLSIPVWEICGSSNRSCPTALWR